jgi:UV DNA damage repair endonuclease
MRKQMTHREFIMLVRFLEAHKQRLQEERPPYAMVAQQASAELGFVCTENNVRTASDACDLTWAARRKIGSGRASQRHVSRILARGLLEIAAALDIKLDQDVHRIANGRRLSEPVEPQTASTTAEGSP